MFESEFGRALSQFEVNTIKEWFEQGSNVSTIKEALNVSILAKVKTVRYIDKVLLEWRRRDEISKEGHSALSDKWRKNLDETIEIAKNKLDGRLMNQKIREKLNEMIENPVGELNYEDDFTLLIAIMLSAQTLDKKVNLVTPLLFDKFKKPGDIKEKHFDEIEEIIRPLGLSKVKAKNIINISKK